MRAIKEVLEQLYLFSPSIVEFGSSITDERIKNFENRNHLILPNDFKKILTKINGFSVMGQEVYGFYPGRAESLENVYTFEHEEVRNPQYPHLVPFSPDGRGNFYCLDTSRLSDGGSTCPVVFWQSDMIYGDSIQPDVDCEDFSDWVKEHVIDWTLEDYHYDGSKKEV